MIFLDVDLSEWVEKFDLSIVKYKCPKCHKTYDTNVPVITKDYAGLQSPIHECGAKYREVVFTPRGSALKKRWEEVMRNWVAGE